MAKIMKAGVIGCGNISQAYFDAVRKLDGLEIKSCADLIMDKAEAKARENGFMAVSVAALLADPEIEIVINLTTPQAHAEVNIQALEAGKNVHCEKPFAINRGDGLKVLALAKEKGLLTGCAPDTFFGGGLQTCRKVIDDGWIGTPVSGTAFMCCPGHESWHPDPGFYYLEGGGPMLDMGPYYLTALVHLLGPVKRVSAICGRKADERLATSEEANGQILPVEVNTHAAGTLEFASGALITMVMSFDVWKHGSTPIEIHGTNGSLKVPDPNCFNGAISIFREGMKDWEKVPYSHGYTENMRSIGAADMAQAIQSGRPNRCSGELAFHVLDIMLAFDESAESGKHMLLTSTCAQPQALPLNLREGQLDD